MEIQPVTQPMQIQPLAQPQGASQSDPHQMLSELLSQMQNLMKPTDQSDPLAPVGVTPKKTAATTTDTPTAGADAAGKAAGGGVMDVLNKLLSHGSASSGSSSKKSDDAPVGIADLLSGKKSFSDTKAGKAVDAVESIGKLLAIL